MEGPERATVIEDRARLEADKPTWLRPYCLEMVPTTHRKRDRLDNMAKKNQAWKRRRQALRDKRLRVKHRSRKLSRRNNQPTSGPTLMERLMAGETFSAEELFRLQEARR